MLNSLKLENDNQQEKGHFGAQNWRLVALKRRFEIFFFSPMSFTSSWDTSGKFFFFLAKVVINSNRQKKLVPVFFYIKLFKRMYQIPSHKEVNEYKFLAKKASRAYNLFTSMNDQILTVTLGKGT